MLFAEITYAWFGGEFHLVKECMGIRSLIALPILALGYAIVCGLNVRRTAAVFALSLFAAVAQNVLRLFLVHLVAMFDFQFASGVFHDFVGYFTFLPALFAVTYYADILKKRGDGGG